ncbi:23S rRNA (pseudouridine(1915)-N(3))-methyltransferase RlmH [Lacrimispora sp. 210928-DFI.3.58]|uniref:23S rRNA (pseudouridine(1915)-N(3))-methyltransferase RlmH n=1 Tax=Lacrimispora sp. 210928-DFI.3.58 TaxID=2883214 RepID=UPI001D08209E|nr:23S rRNA (pseudouridine(1915)-N(3))-methyltransferase RlmH [Lacrimispora sp. 210928-DFI.3.58]MCB7317220.1 23S rRNA (pseudouridine(1915)-N(3))-methyltransferase RlmH [Lacrimispora sp. 210928-DFI.3.58]
MKITLVTVGKIKERYFEDAVKEYQKRLSRYCRLEILQVADEKTPDGASEAVERQIKEKEGQRILDNIRDGAFVVALAIEGEMLSSEQLAEKIDKLGIRGVSHIVFVIGGSLGLSEAVMNRADYALSFSKMTFPHQLMRVVLLEQIYRSYRIIAGEPYHK